MPGRDQHHFKKRQLKILVISSFLIVFIVWIFWLASGRLTNRQSFEKAELFSNILETSQEAGTKFGDVKGQINKSWQELQAVSEAAQKQQEVVAKLKEKLSQATSTEATSTQVELEDK